MNEWKMVISESFEGAQTSKKAMRSICAPSDSELVRVDDISKLEVTVVAT
jgi:hypothetical protein